MHAMPKNWNNLKRKMSSKSRARVDARVADTLKSMPLAELRKAMGLTQVQLAETLDMGQATVSKVERSTDMYLSTLRRFIAALGGELVLKATFPDGREMIIDQLSHARDPDDGGHAGRRSA